MEMIKDMIKDMFVEWYKSSTNLIDNDWTGWVMLLLIWIVNIFIIFLIYTFCIRPILYQKKYSKTKIDKGKIVDKEYQTYVTTTYVQSGKTSIPIMTTHHNYYVYIKGDIVDQRVDCESWYNEFSSGESVKIEYKEIYEKLRFSINDDWEFIGNDVLYLERTQ